MNTIEIPTNWKLSTNNRLVRGVVGASAILAILLVPGLSEGWVFALAIIGFYASQTALLNIDLCYAFLTPGVHSQTGGDDETRMVPPTPREDDEERPVYKKAA